MGTGTLVRAALHKMPDPTCSIPHKKLYFVMRSICTELYQFEIEKLLINQL